MHRLLYNLNFLWADDFQSFTVDGYTFHPISEKQPVRGLTYNSNNALKYNRDMHLNARVSLPPRQKDSIFHKGGRYTENRKIKFLEDLLVVISVCIGRNVVPKFYEKRRDFPLCSVKHCETVSKNSNELKAHLEIAIEEIMKNEWQKKYDNGFHIRAFYNAANILVVEPRFLADVTIWEYLFYCNNKSMTYDDLKRKSLNTKINYLVKQYLVDNNSSIPEERLRVFSDLRNQLSHSGKLPIENPKSPFQKIGWHGCEQYLLLFKWLTQALVLKTIKIDAIGQMSTLSVQYFLEELLRNGEIALFKQLEHLKI